VRNCTVAHCTQCSAIRLFALAVDLATHCPINLGRSSIPISPEHTVLRNVIPHVRPPVYCVKYGLVGLLFRSRHIARKDFTQQNSPKSRV
jgi:hypothetical protein